MANNRRYVDGRKLYMPVEAGTLSGSPVVVGSRCGVALTDRDAAGNATVEHKGVFALTVNGVTAIGTPIYYTANANPALRLGVVATALFFGYALQAQAAPGIVDVYVSEASGISALAAGSLAGTVVANVAADNVIGGIPLTFIVAIPGGAAAAKNVLMTHKVRVIDVHAVHTGGAGEANDTITVGNGANAITDAMSWAGADAAVVRAASLDDANHEIAIGGSLRVTTTDDDAGGDVGAGIVYVTAIRVA
ncbi:MAG: capsid cement protein [Chloroflexota bacterium]